MKIAGVLVVGLASAIALTPRDTADSLDSPATPAAVASAADSAQPQKIAVVEPALATAPTPTPEKAKPAKTAAACGQSTARKDCVAARAAKAALLEVPQETSPSSPVVESVAEPAANTPPAAVHTAATEALAAADPVAPEAAPASTPLRTAAKKKTAVAAKKPRYPDDLLVERLVRVYDRILPDGRVVSVYRRASGGYESGSITYGEYRRASAAPLDRPRYFGLQ